MYIHVFSTGDSNGYNICLTPMCAYILEKKRYCLTVLEDYFCLFFLRYVWNVIFSKIFCYLLRSDVGFQGDDTIGNIMIFIVFKSYLV